MPAYSDVWFSDAAFDEANKVGKPFTNPQKNILLRVILVVSFFMFYFWLPMLIWGQ